MLSLYGELDRLPDAEFDAGWKFVCERLAEVLSTPVGHAVVLTADGASEHAFRRLDVPTALASVCAPSSGSVRDRLSVVVPARLGVKVGFVFERPHTSECFSEEERRLAYACVPGFLRTARGVAFAYGPLAFGRSLGDRERAVLSLLLAGRSEKEAAVTLGMTCGALHQLVLRVYRRLGVRSRAELMALWLDDRAERGECATAKTAWLTPYRWRPKVSGL